jgi:hypothetical protein
MGKGYGKNTCTKAKTTLKGDEMYVELITKQARD